MNNEFGWLHNWVVETADLPRGSDPPRYFDARFDRFLSALERDIVRAAIRGSDGVWRAVPWVKMGILLGFRFGRLVEMSPPAPPAERLSGSGSAVANPDTTLQFFDKHTYPMQRFLAIDNIRIVPGGSSVRRGAFVASGVVCMPPMYINVGAHVGTGTMVDSHALIGSCAQIGGVLEPVSASPVVVENDALIGGNCGVYEGTVIREGAVLAAGVILTRGTPVFDLVKETVHRATPETPLIIPAKAVVVPGSRLVRSPWGAEFGLSLQTPVIVKYRDEKTDLSSALEEWLR